MACAARRPLAAKGGLHQIMAVCAADGTPKTDPTAVATMVADRFAARSGSGRV